MHLLEVALFAQFDAFDHKRREPDEPMPEQWPRPRRSRIAIAARAALAIGIAVVVVAVVVAGSGH